MLPPDSAAIQISADRPSGVINANSSVIVELTLKVFERAVINFPLRFNILGSEEAPLDVAIGCVGEGAVVSLAPSQIDWGKIPVLTDVPRSIILTNESLIKASFHCAVEPDDGIFTVDTSSGELAPGESRKVTIHTNVDDTIKFGGSFKVEYGDANPPQYVPLIAIGTGSTITASPSLDQVDFSSQFSGRECSKAFVLTNHSRRTQRLFFALDSPPPNSTGHCTVMRGAQFKRTRTPACPNPPDASRSVFGFYPEKVVLEPEEEAVVEIRGLCSEIQV
jgi:hydrocephalus-inducing protein